MGLILILEWFDKSDEVLISKETSADLGQNGSIIKKLIYLSMEEYMMAGLMY